MTFEEILDHALAMLQRRGRVTFRTLQLQFQLDNDHLAALKDELLYAHPEVAEDLGRGLVWTGAPATVLPPRTALTPDHAQPPLVYTPSHLAEKILTSKSALEGERKQVTVLFADLKGSIGDPPAPLQHGKGVVEDLLEGHGRSPPSRGRVPPQTVRSSKRRYGMVKAA